MIIKSVSPIKASLLVSCFTFILFCLSLYVFEPYWVQEFDNETQTFEISFKLVICYSLMFSSLLSIITLVFLSKGKLTNSNEKLNDVLNNKESDIQKPMEKQILLHVKPKVDIEKIKKKGMTFFKENDELQNILPSKKQARGYNINRM